MPRTYRPQGFSIWEAARTISDDKREISFATSRGCRRWRRPVDSFFPPCCFEPAILEESVGDHRHERMTIQPAKIGPRSDRDRVLLSAAAEPARKSLAP